MKIWRVKEFGAVVIALAVFAGAEAQSRKNVRVTDEGGSVLSVVGFRTDKSNAPIRVQDLFLYENGIEQKIKNFTYDPTPSKIVLLVDNSQTVRADIEKLQEAVKEFAYEIYEGDQLFVVGYDEKAEIIQEWTDDAKKIETAVALFRKKGNPFLFDALSAVQNDVLLPLMPGNRKCVVVLIGDGLDRGSKTPFEKILGDLQKSNITVYALQLPDRTGGAFRRNQPKAVDVITQLTEGTGGVSFSFDESQTAAKAICDELRKNRYLLNYFPTNTSTYDARRIFLIGQEGITLRTKVSHPPTVK